MINIESLKDYVDTSTEEELMTLARKIYMLTDSMCNDYPRHNEWFFTKQLPATINSDERNILFIRNPKDDNEIISMTCLKRDNEEQKLCTIYVSDKYRKLGIGKAIVEESMRWLGTKKPLITFPAYKLETMKSVIKEYGWELTEIVTGLYNDGVQELCFNGKLTKNNDTSLH